MNSTTQLPSVGHPLHLRLMAADNVRMAAVGINMPKRKDKRRRENHGKKSEGAERDCNWMRGMSHRSAGHHTHTVISCFGSCGRSIFRPCRHCRLAGVGKLGGMALKAASRLSLAALGIRAKFLTVGRTRRSQFALTGFRGFGRLGERHERHQMAQCDGDQKSLEHGCFTSLLSNGLQTMVRQQTRCATAPRSWTPRLEPVPEICAGR
jgi:hypothetical protein